MANDERLRELEDKYEGFTVYDRDGDKIGKVDDLFVDDSDREEYIGVKMGLFGLSGTTLIPMERGIVKSCGSAPDHAATFSSLFPSTNFPFLNFAPALTRATR
jgi:hypothetical protein